MRIVLSRLPYLSALLLLTAGCSGGGNTPTAPLAPATPDSGAADLPTATTPDPVARPADPNGQALDAKLPTGLDPSGLSGTTPMGLYRFAIDTATMDATLEPAIRTAQIGEDFEVDVTGFFRQNPCGDCMQVVGLGLDANGNVLADLRVRHPFALPVPGTGRLDLHIFDLTLSAFLPGTSADPRFQNFADLDVRPSTTGSATLQLRDPGFMVNADGYSAHLDAVLESLIPTGATAHPFKQLRVEDIVPGEYDPATVSGFADLRDPHGFNVFPMGAEATTQFVLDFGGASQIELFLVLDAKYGVSARGNIPTGQPGSRQNPRYFLPGFNRKEAWRIETELTENNLIDNDNTSDATLEVRINDWQQANGTVNPDFDPLTAPLDSLQQSSQVSEVTFAAPGIFPGVLTSTTPLSGDGSIGDPLVFEFNFPGALSPGAGRHWAAVAVRDEYRESGAGEGGGVERDGVSLFDLADYSTYQVVAVDVAAANQAPRCALEATPPSGSSVGTGTMVTLDGTGTTDDNDPPASLVFEWDLTYDGTFDPTPGLDTPIITPTLTNAGPGDIDQTIAMRVRDTAGAVCDPPETATYTITSNAPPLCQLTSTPPSGSTVKTGDSVQLDASATTDDSDPPASLTYEWDLSYDGVTFNPDGGFSGPITNPTLTNAGLLPITLTLAMRATDTEGAFCNPPATVIIIVDPDFAPTCRLESTPPSGSTINSGDSVTLDGSTTTDDLDPPASLTFEWDLDYDGITFIADPGFSGPVISPTLFNSGTVIVARTLAMRVTDTNGGFCEPPASVTISIRPDAPPNCQLDSTPPSGSTVATGSTVTLDASGTTDDIDPPASLTFEWDLDYDGVTFVPDPGFSGSIITPTLFNGGASPILIRCAMRATDTAGGFCDPPAEVVFTVNPNNPPVCDLEVDPPSGSLIDSGTTVTLDGSGTTDDLQPTVTLLFEWDLDYDGSFNADPGFSGIGNSIITPTLYNTGASPDLRSVAMRASDSLVQACTVQTASYTINPNQPPVAIIDRPGATTPFGTGIWGVANPYPNIDRTIPIYLNRTQSADFDGSLSFDLDGVLTDWEWDFQNVNLDPNDLGIGFSIDVNDMNPGPFSYPTYGSTFTVLRVRDDAGAVAYKRREIVVTPFQPQVKIDTPSNPDAMGWYQNQAVTGNTLSRRGNYIIAGGVNNPSGITLNSVFVSYNSTDGGAAWSAPARVDDGVSNAVIRSAIDAANGVPYAAFLTLDGDLFFRRATAATGDTMWLPGSPAQRKTITTGAAAGYGGGTIIDMAVQPGAPATVVVAVVSDTLATGNVEFWITNDANLGPTSMWAPLTVIYDAQNPGDVQGYLDVRFDQSGHIHAVWQEVSSSGFSRVRYAQLDSAGAGTNFGAQFVGNGAGFDGDIDPQLLIDTSERPVVVFASDALGDADIYLTRGTAANIPSFTLPSLVNTDSAHFPRVGGPLDQRHPSVADDASNRLWVSWMDFRENSFGFFNGEIYAHVFESTLTSVTPDVVVNNFDPYNIVADRFPLIVSDRTTPGAIYVGWVADRNGGTNDMLGASAILF